jgi:hypothetical protein
MPLSAAEMDLMGSTNNYWGVCGFTSSFYSMYELNPGKRALLVGAGIATKVLAEIKTYLMMLKAAGNVTLLNEIETFTKSFGVVGKCDFGTFTIDSYIQRINEAVTKSDDELKGNCYYSIAMPPDAVADYLRRMWEYDSEISIISGGSGGTEDGIIGVNKANGTMKLYDGLCHYMYRLGGKIYSWGRVFNSVPEANADYRVCRLIKINRGGSSSAASSSASASAGSSPARPQG